MSDSRFRFMMKYRFEAGLVALLGLGILGVGFAWGGTIGTSFRERFEHQANLSHEARAICERTRASLDGVFSMDPADLDLKRARRWIDELGRLPLTPHSTREAYQLFFAEDERSLRQLWVVSALGRLQHGCMPIQFFSASHRLVAEADRLGLSTKDRRRLKRAIHRYVSDDLKGHSSFLQTLIEIRLLRELTEAEWLGNANSKNEFRSLDERAKALKDVLSERYANLPESATIEELREEAYGFIDEAFAARDLRVDFRRAFETLESTFSVGI